MGSVLAQLPVELLIQIISHFETARTLFYFSQTCKRLHDYVERDGFRVFVQNRFPSIQTPPFWRDAAHALTTLSRNWDRRAFLARYLMPKLDRPSAYSEQRPKYLWKLPVTQAMKYQPILDSYEECMGGNWSSRKQIVAWGSGSELFLRSKRMGEILELVSEDALVKEQPSGHLDQHHHRSSWATYRQSCFVEGLDNITSINLLPSLSGHDQEMMVVGRASGDLNLLNVSTSSLQSRVLTEFATNRRRVRSATTNKLSSPLLAVCLSDSSLALYPIHPEEGYTKPVDVNTIRVSEKAGKMCCTRFLRSDRLAIGLKSSHEAIHVYDVTPDGLSKEPIRRFGFGSQSTAPPSTHPKCSSVYHFAPLSPSSLAGGAEGDIFLSGGYDSNARYVNRDYMPHLPKSADLPHIDSMISAPLHHLAPSSRMLLIIPPSFTPFRHLAVNDSLLAVRIAV